MIQLAAKTLKALDRAIEIKQGAGFRNHLGASLIGDDCARAIWYTFRWAKKSSFGGRMLRLFDRGNKEETRLIGWLRGCGVHVVEIDPETKKQFRIVDHDEHFGGSLDALLFDAPDFPAEWVLGEFKTHADKYFKEVVKLGVAKAFPKHYAQMQVYMHYKGLRAALYFAVNKNDDDIHIEIVWYDQTVALTYIERAGRIIQSPYPPARINESPGWYKCNMCHLKPICHEGRSKEKNCRTCVNSKPIDRGRWLCTRFNYVLSEQEQKVGCHDYKPIPED